MYLGSIWELSLSCGKTLWTRGLVLNKESNVRISPDDLIIDNLSPSCSASFTFKSDLFALRSETGDLDSVEVSSCANRSQFSMPHQVPQTSLMRYIAKVPGLKDLICKEKEKYSYRLRDKYQMPR
jgi:hypothetical protein